MFRRFLDRIGQYIWVMILKVNFWDVFKYILLEQSWNDSRNFVWSSILSYVT